jgi:acetyltransferase-like isoleucine patch superfamily enzyme
MNKTGGQRSKVEGQRSKVKDQRLVMRENLVQTGQLVEDGRIFIEYDWYTGGIPSNVKTADGVYLDTSYGFAAFHSERETGMELGEGSGTYDRASFVVGKDGRVKVGTHTVLNGTTIISNDYVEIGNHCLLAWGSVITDSWTNFENADIEKRREMLRTASQDGNRQLLPVEKPRPVVVEDNVWIGFDAVILPGVRLGRGAVIGCKTIIIEDVPPYAVMVGNPARLIKFLASDDTEEAVKQAFIDYLK